LETELHTFLKNFLEDSNKGSLLLGLWSKIPPFVLADEPTGNLDKESGLNILNILKELNNQGKTVIMITHNQEHADMFEKVIELVDGKVVNR
jgi:ABC-type lipoprotein export system ATPase subunit